MYHVIDMSLIYLDIINISGAIELIFNGRFWTNLLFFWYVTKNLWLIIF